MTQVPNCPWDTYSADENNEFRMEQTVPLNPGPGFNEVKVKLGHKLRNIFL